MDIYGFVLTMLTLAFIQATEWTTPTCTASTYLPCPTCRTRRWTLTWKTSTCSPARTIDLLRDRRRN